MSAMMGLATRLRLARTLAWTGLQNSPDELAALVRQLVGKRTDLVVVVQPDAREDDLAQGFRAAAAARDGNLILGLAHDLATAREVHADLIAVNASAELGRGHQWGLCVAVAGNPASAQRALADDQVDALVISAELVEQLAQAAPPAEAGSKPWFCQVADLQQARQALERGARRFAFEVPPAELSGQLRDLLLAPWRTEMEQFTFAAMQADQVITRPVAPRTAQLAEGERWVIPTED